MARSCCSYGAQVNVAVRLLATMLAMQLACCAAMESSTGKPSKLFVFGDSYADTGNRDPRNGTQTPIGRVNQPWVTPYGKTRPGSPAGRFSDGFLFTDLLAGYMGLSTPIPYRVYKANTSQSITDGMNFAVGGSGEFDNLGFTKTSDQIGEFRRLINHSVYDYGDIVDKSLILLSISGNDYASFVRNGNTTDQLPAFVLQVVAQIVTDLKSLYDIGFRKFAVSKLEQIACLPSETAAFNYTTCNAVETPLTTGHNTLLVSSISSSMPEADVLFLDNESAFDSVLLFNFGNFSNPLKPCCIPKAIGNLCGDVDSGGNPLYTVCGDPSQTFFWDEHHPTEAGWRYIFALFIADPLFTGGRNLTAFLS